MLISRIDDYHINMEAVFYGILNGIAYILEALGLLKEEQSNVEIDMRP